MLLISRFVTHFSFALNMPFVELYANHGLLQKTARFTRTLSARVYCPVHQPLNRGHWTHHR